MRARIVRVGNSRGLRIPKVLLEQAGIGEAVDLAVENGSLVVRPARRPRDGWATTFQEMAEGGNDAVLDDDVPTAFDQTEWEWPEQTPTSD